jgi:hypothetical protein
LASVKSKGSAFSVLKGSPITGKIRRQFKFMQAKISDPFVQESEISGLR